MKQSKKGSKSRLNSPRTPKKHNILPQKDVTKEFSATITVSRNQVNETVSGTVIINLLPNMSENQTKQFLFTFQMHKTAQDQPFNYNFSTIIVNEPKNIKDIPFPYEIPFIKTTAPFSLVSIQLEQEDAKSKTKIQFFLD